MKNLMLIFLVTEFLVQARTEAEEFVPLVQIDELVTPWGIPADRVSYYLKDGVKIQHGLEEMYSLDGTLIIRNRYSHGEADGLQEYFYDGIGSKQSEVRYLAGVEVGLSRTWSAKGEVLFEGTYKDGEEWDGLFIREHSGGEGSYYRHQETWTVVGKKLGQVVAGSEKKFQSVWRSRKVGALPDHKMFVRWNWSRFMKRGGYSYLDKMPPYEAVPVLIEHCAKKERG